jgi:hypothetical protein
VSSAVKVCKLVVGVDCYTTAGTISNAASHDSRLPTLRHVLEISSINSALSFFFKLVSSDLLGDQSMASR